MRHLRRSSLVFAAAILVFAMRHAARSSDSPLLGELPPAEGKDLIAPYEFWVATFAPDEGSYPKGPRVLLITNDRETAVAYVSGNRVQLPHVGELVWQCDDGGSMAETYEAGDVTVETRLTTSPGEESCWVEGTISVTVGRSTEMFRVKGVSGL